MASTDLVPEPFQFRLRSIFLATAAIAVALALLKLHWIFFIPIIHASASGLLVILARRKALVGAALGFVLAGSVFFGVLLLDWMPTEDWGVGAFLLLSTATFGSWIGGAIGAIEYGAHELGVVFLLGGGLWSFFFAPYAWICLPIVLIVGLVGYYIYLLFID